MIDGSFVEAPRQHNTREENRKKQERGFVRRQCLHRQRGEEGDAEVRDEGQGDQAEHPRQEDQQMAGDHQQEELEAAREGGTCVRVHGRVPSRNVQPSGRLCAERGLQHPDKPGLQPVPVRASYATQNELNN